MYLGIYYSIYSASHMQIPLQHRQTNHTPHTTHHATHTTHHTPRNTQSPPLASALIKVLAKSKNGKQLCTVSSGGGPSPSAPPSSLTTGFFFSTPINSYPTHLKSTK